MDKNEFKVFMDDQIKEIEKYKWIESEKAGHDLGRECCMEWVLKYAKLFRKKYEETHCKK